MKSAMGVMVIIFQLLAAAFSWAGPKEEMERRLNFGLRIFPLILAADKDVHSKAGKEGALLLLVYKDDREGAEALKEWLEKKKPLVKKKIPVVTEIIAESAMEGALLRGLGGIFLTEELSHDAFQKIIKFGVKHQVIVFSPIIGDVERGATAGIYISTRTMPSLNLTTVKKSAIRIDKRFRKLSKKYR